MKSTKQISFSIVFFILIACVFNACKKKEEETSISCNGINSTYNSNIKTIINSSCAISGCHPSYSNYLGIKAILDNGAFNRVVLEEKSMPKGSRLTSNQLSELKCWVEGGYKEN